MRIVIIGNSKIAADCLEFVFQDNDHELVGVLFEPKKNPSPAVLIDAISNYQIPFLEINGSVNGELYLQFLQELQPDWILNINCYQYLKSSLLEIPTFGVINFHNGPLPKYGGVNISSWPIINGEKKHGVTWHLVNAGIDTGDILSQSLFEISEDITAAQLMAKCIQEGILLFQRDWKGWVSGDIKAHAQLGERTYYSKKDFAPNNGLLDWNQNAEKLHALVRGLHLFPYPNDFAYAHFYFQGQKYWVIATQIIRIDSGEKPGTILERHEKYCLIQCSSGGLQLKMIAPEFGKPMKWSAFYELMEMNSVNILV